jgi:hypothetical protein
MELRKARCRVSQAERFFWLDIVLVTGLVAARATAEAGSPVHEIVALVWAASLVMHLVWHRRWLGSLLRPPRPGLARARRFTQVVNVVLGIVVLLVVGTGFAAGVLPGTQWPWRHHLVSEISVLLMAVHVALHGRWLVGAGRMTWTRVTGGIGGRTRARGSDA